jgi:hypothetical protein
MDHVTLRWQNFSSNFVSAREQFRSRSCIYVLLSSDGPPPLYIGKTKNGLRSRYGESLVGALFWECGCLNMALLANLRSVQRTTAEAAATVAEATAKQQAAAKEHLRTMLSAKEQFSTVRSAKLNNELEANAEALAKQMAAMAEATAKEQAELTATLSKGEALIATMSQNPTRLVVAEVEKELCVAVEQTLIRCHHPRFNARWERVRQVELVHEGDVPFSKP